MLKTHMSLVAALITCTSCTYNISMAHTQGRANDVIDDNQTPTSTMTADVQVPVKAI